MITSAIAELQQVVSAFLVKFGEITDESFSEKPNPRKWSKKEVLGHLIDSAQNNLRRFICAQYEDNPKITYQQDFWVDANNYKEWKKADLLQLWKLVNDQIAHVLNKVSTAHYARTIDTGGSEYHSIEWLAADYVKHLKHHINQIIPGSFNVTYP